MPSRVLPGLYVGEGDDNSVKRFDTTTGAYQGEFVTSGSGGLAGPRGMVFDKLGELVVSNQNVNLPINGEIDLYSGKSGASLGALVSATDPNAPFAPRGIVVGPHNTLYIADMGNLGAGAPGGRVERFDAKTGAFLGDLVPTGFTGEFNPRSVVFGPDGLLYVSLRNLAPTGGEVLRFDTKTGAFLGDFIDSNPTNDLNRPEGLVFGPDGNLYVTSFRTNSSDNDKVLIFNGKTGAYLDKIDLDQVGQPRAFAQAILFGPGGSLFVPISGNGPDTGEVRRYDVATKNFTVFVAPNAQGGALVQPWYLTFAKTNRSTLAYGEDDGGDGQDSLSSVAGTSNTVQAPVGLAAVLVTAHNTSSSGAGIVSPGQKADSKSSNSTPALTTAGRGVHQSHVNTPARQAAAHDRVFAHSRSNSLHSAMIDDLAMSLVV